MQAGKRKRFFVSRSSYIIMLYSACFVFHVASVAFAVFICLLITVRRVFPTFFFFA